MSSSHRRRRRSRSRAPVTPAISATRSGSSATAPRRLGRADGRRPRTYRILPAGLDALDVTRVEAGFIMNGVDYFSAHHCLIDARKIVALRGRPRLDGPARPRTLHRPGGLAARRSRRPAKWRLVGSRSTGTSTERSSPSYGLPPELPGGAWRDGRPGLRPQRHTLDRPGDQRRLVADPQEEPGAGLRSRPAFAGPGGASLDRDHGRVPAAGTVEATVVKTPFFDPERKRA